MYVITTSLPHICEMDKRTQERHLKRHVGSVGRAHITNVMRLIYVVRT